MAIVLLAFTALSHPVCAHLVPISWGFPVFIQNNSLTGLQTQMQAASDVENVNIGFNGAGFGSLFGGAFPNIGQFSHQNALATSLGFADQRQSTTFAYPYLSIGGAPVPGMGFL
ncbi:hypothetical protein [Methanocella conradii]|uniref:hypothetical protein n=1 Tax=Methanocella conradii TaxID=1175444 RepID=UPI001ED96A83|nr:hypothetical protein [Methanocella conradii]